MNVLSDEMLVALQAEVDAAAQDEAVRVVVIAGAGRAFCAGHDLRQMRANADMAYLQRLFRDCTKLMLSLQRLPQPVVARVHGIATAAGCQLVSMCDLAVAADDATFGIDRHQCRARLLDALGGSDAKHRPQGRVRDAASPASSSMRALRTSAASSTAW